VPILVLLSDSLDLLTLRKIFLGLAPFPYAFSGLSLRWRQEPPLFTYSVLLPSVALVSFLSCFPCFSCTTPLPFALSSLPPFPRLVTRRTDSRCVELFLCNIGAPLFNKFFPTSRPDVNRSRVPPRPSFFLCFHCLVFAPIFFHLLQDLQLEPLLPSRNFFVIIFLFSPVSFSVIRELLHTKNFSPFTFLTLFPLFPHSLPCTKSAG